MKRHRTNEEIPRLSTGAALPLLALCSALAAAAGVVDRVAVVVDRYVITESQILEELRVDEFLNGQSLDLSAAARRAAGERLVDQQLLRTEMEISGFQPPSPAEADSMLRNFRREHYPDDAAFRAALAKYGISEEDLKRHLLWELALIRFTDVRFRPGMAAGSQQGADRVGAGAASPADSVDEQMEAWLKEARSRTRIQFRNEAFQ